MTKKEVTDSLKEKIEAFLDEEQEYTYIIDVGTNKTLLKQMEIKIMLERDLVLAGSRYGKTEPKILQDLVEQRKQIIKG